MRSPVKPATIQLAFGGAAALSVFAAIFLPVLVTSATNRERFNMAVAIFLVAGGISLGALTSWRVRRAPDSYQAHPLQEGLIHLGLIMLLGFVGVVVGQYMLRVD